MMKMEDVEVSWDDYCEMIYSENNNHLTNDDFSENDNYSDNFHSKVVEQTEFIDDASFQVCWILSQNLI